MRKREASVFLWRSPTLILGKEVSDLKRVFQLLGVVLCLMVILGSAQAAPKETINFASMNDPFAYVIEKMLPKFEAETGIHVNMDIIPYTGLREKTLTDFVSRAGTYDVVTMDIVWMGEWAEAGFVEQLDGRIAADKIDMKAFLPGALEGLAYWKGKTYGMPIGAYYFLMYYRTDLFAEKGLGAPKTFSDVFAAGKAIQNPKNNVYGIAVPIVRGAPIVHYSLAYLTGAGGEVMDPETHEVGINSKIAKQVYNYYKDFQTIGPPGMTSYDWFSVSDAFQQGRVGMLGAWTVVAPGFENPEESRVAGKVGYTYLPTLSANDHPIVPFGGWSLTINAFSRKKDVAWQFIKWLTREDIQLEYARNLGTPVLFSVLRNKELQKRFPWYPLVLNAEENGWVNAQYRPRIPQWPRMEEALGLLLNQAVIGEKTVDEALGQAERELTTILKSAK